MMPVNEYARRYLEDLLSFFGLNVRVEDRLVEDNMVELNVPSTRLNGFLIGQHGRNLQSIQHLTNMAVRRNGYEEARVTVDVANYKAQQKHRLEQKATEIAQRVINTGENYEFEPMHAAHRRVIHQLAGETEGIESQSEGEGLARHVVLKKTSPTPAPPTPAQMPAEALEDNSENQDSEV